MAYGLKACVFRPDLRPAEDDFFVPQSRHLSLLIDWREIAGTGRSGVDWQRLLLAELQPLTLTFLDSRSGGTIAQVRRNRGLQSDSPPIP
jgi:hypothetical protein